jgi:hypothetical protein
VETGRLCYAAVLAPRAPHCVTNGATLQIRNAAMIWTIAIVLLVLWLLGLITSHTFGGFIYILLVVALIIVVVNAVHRRR